MSPTKTETGADRQVDVKILPIDDIIVEDGFNPRTIIEEVELGELAESIKAIGLLQAVSVTPYLDGPNRGKYKLVGGHRRHAACLRVGVTQIPATVRAGDDVQQLADAIVDNQFREDLSPLDEALAFDRLRDLGLTNRGIHEKTGLSLKRIAERLVIADLPADIRDRFRSQWPTSTARPLAAICELMGGEHVARRIVELMSDPDRPTDLQHYEPLDFGKDPLVVTQAVAKHSVGMINVVASSKAGGGWSLKGSYRYVPERMNGIKPSDLPSLPRDARDRINAMNAAGHSHEKYVVIIDQPIVDALRAGNVLYGVADHKDRGVCVDEPTLAGLVTSIVQADHQAFTKAKVEFERSRPKSPAAQVKADEKAREQAERAIAHDWNLKLGEALFQHFAEVDLTSEVVEFLTSVAMARDVIEVNLPWALAKILPQWQESIENKDGSTTIRYAGDGTAAKQGDATLVDALANVNRQPEELFAEWWALARTSRQQAGRTIIAYAAAQHADHRALPANRHWYGGGVFSDTYPESARCGELLDALLKGKLPPKPGEQATSRRQASIEKQQAQGAQQKTKTAAKKTAAKPKPKAAAKGQVPEPKHTIVKVAPVGGQGDPVDAELQPDRQDGRPNLRKVIYVESRSAAWISKDRIVTDASTTNGNGAAAKGAKLAEAPAGTEKGSRAERVLAWVVGKPTITIPEIAEAMGVAQNMLYRILPGLEKDGLVGKSGRGWTATETGRNEHEKRIAKGSSTKAAAPKKAGTTTSPPEAIKT